MAFGVNKVTLMGNLGQDPQIRALESGVKVAILNLATTESYTERDGNKVDKTEWHRVVLWRGLAEVAEKYLTKGAKVYIEGKITYRQYTDKDNIVRFTTEIVGQQMIMLGPNSGNSTNFSSNLNDSSNHTSVDTLETTSGTVDDLPF